MIMTSAVAVLQEYHVTLQQPPTPQQLQLLRAGTTVEGVHCQPKLVQVLNTSGSSISNSSSGKGGNISTSRSSRGSGRSVVRIDVSEGKKHEVGGTTPDIVELDTLTLMMGKKRFR